jgi:hypothetical protein
MSEPSADVKRVLDWVRTEINCGNVMFPKTAEERAWNAANDRSLRIIANYYEGMGLFQMTAKVPPESGAA